MNTRTTMRTLARSGWRLVVLMATIMLVTALPREVAAQSANATLRGNAPADSEITAKNVNTGLTRRAKASGDGSYVIVGLPPGTYQVNAGPGTEEVVELAIGSTSTLDFEGAPGAAAPEPGAGETANVQEVVVTGRRLQEVKTSEVGAGVSLHQIETTPQVTRNFLEFADTIPGVAFEVDAKGNTSLHAGPLNTGTTNVYIDGVGQKNYVRSSGLTGQGGADPNQNTVGDPGNPFPQLAIGEYKVISSNYKAEYDQVSGAAITAVTRSGTNKFEAEAFMSYTNASFRAATPPELVAGGDKVGGTSKEFGMAVGGPIIQDRLHYFFTYEGKQFDTPNSVQAPLGLVDDNNVALDWVGGLTDELRANYGPVANPFKEGLYFGKVDWEFSDNDRLEFSSKYRRERQQAGAAGIVAESAASTYVNDDKRFQLRWERTMGSLFNEATVTYEKATDSPSKASDEPGQAYRALGTSGAGFDIILQVNGVDPRSYFFTAQRGYSVQDDLTFSNINWHGDHTVKTGVKFKDVKLEDRDAGTSALYTTFVSPAGIEPNPFQVTFGSQADNNLPITSTSKNRQYGIYIQDDWSVNDHLLLNLGVRYDYEQTPTWTDFVTPQRFVDSFNSLDPNGCANQTDPGCFFIFSGAYRGAQPGNTYADTLAVGGININDYISNGHNRKNPSDEIQPRLGLSYDLNADQRHVIFAGAGRSYDRNVFGILQHETNKATLNVPTVQFWNAGNNGCLPGTVGNPTCIEWNDIYLTAAGLQSIAPAAFGEAHLINNNIKAPYSDQFSIGMRNRVRDWYTSLSVVRILSYDGLVATLGNRFGDGSWYWYDSFHFASEAPAPNAGGSSLWLFDNAKETRTTQVLLSVEKPYTRESHWSANFAYTYSHAKEKMEFQGDYQFDYAFPNLATFVFSNQVPKHRMVAVGSFDGPWGITLGAKLELETPRPFTNFRFDPNFPPPNGLNYNYPKSSLFPDYTLAYRSLDLQATKSFQWANGPLFQLRFDVLNATNYKNYADFVDNYNGGSLPGYYKDGNLRGVPRTFKVGANFKW